MGPRTIAKNAPASVTFAILILAVQLPVIASQTGSASGAVAQSFEVAAVRPNNSGPFGLAPLQVQPNGSVFASNVPLRGLIWYAYGLASYESIEGDSAYLEKRFDVNAKAATPPNQEGLGNWAPSTS